MKSIISVLALGLVLFGMSACVQQTGCTMPQADNYDPQAKENDGSCIYSKNTMIYWDAAEGQKLQDSNVNSVYFQIEGNYYYSSSPTYGVAGAASEPSFDYSYPVISTQGYNYYSYDDLSVYDNGDMTQEVEIVAFKENGWNDVEIGRWTIPLVVGEDLVYKISGFYP